MRKVAVSALVGLLITLGLVWQAEAFFSRDHWFPPQNNNSGGGTTESLLTNGPVLLGNGNDNWTDGSNDYTGTNGHVPPPTTAPEPSTILLVVSGLAGLGLWRIKKETVRS